MQTTLFLLAACHPLAHAGGDSTLAQRHYRLYCMGCHLADGSGSPKNYIPSMREQVGRFLDIPGGRAYLGQVPGLLNTPLSDEETAQVLNWVLINIGKDSTPFDFKPYDGAEIGRLRASVPQNIPQIRQQLIEQFTP